MQIDTIINGDNLKVMPEIFDSYARHV